jgi:hypothetical protein
MGITGPGESCMTSKESGQNGKWKTNSSLNKLSDSNLPRRCQDRPKTLPFLNADHIVLTTPAARWPWELGKNMMRDFTYILLFDLLFFLFDYIFSKNSHLNEKSHVFLPYKLVEMPAGIVSTYSASSVNVRFSARQNPLPEKAPP